jgi:tetratricopeptide (TPR) repeat protein
MLVRTGIGCVTLIILACVGIGGFAFYENWQQEQNYNAGHAAYLKADCATAVGPLGKAASGDPGTKDSDVADKAQAELEECQALQAGDDLSAGGSLGDAVMSYSAFAAKYADSPLNATAQTKGAELIASNDAEKVASASLCDSIDSLAEQKFIASPDEQLPPLLNACGQVYEQASDYTKAVEAYNRFRHEYPDHALAEQVEAAYVRATLAEAEALGAGSLPAPQAVGESSGGTGTVTVVIQNDSPEQLSMVFSGPDTRVEDLEKCVDCESFAGTEPDACPELGPVGRYELAPGTYEVVVKASSDGSVTPFRGTWTLEEGQEYSSCFYLVTN